MLNVQQSGSSRCQSTCEFRVRVNQLGDEVIPRLRIERSRPTRGVLFPVASTSVTFTLSQATSHMPCAVIN